jgi:hypothetical protein
VSQLGSYPHAKEDWVDTLSLPEPACRRHLIEVYSGLASEDEAARDEVLSFMLEAECELDEHAFHSATEARLRSWLALSPREAAAIAASYDTVMKSAPAGPAMRRVISVQTLLNSMSVTDQERLREIIPSSVAGAGLGGPGLERAPPKAPPRWAFWRRKATAPDVTRRQVPSY